MFIDFDRDCAREEADSRESDIRNGWKPASTSISNLELPPRPYRKSKDLFFDMQMEYGEDEHHDYRSQEEEEYYFTH